MKFNEIAKNARLDQRLSLRQFCQEAGLDPSNWSKIERGVNPPSGDPEIMERIADKLKLFGDSRKEFFDAADIARSQIPADILSDEDLVRKLPAFFRVMRGNQMTQEQADMLLADIRKQHTPTPPPTL
ncbi:MAG: helix-turn-helix transcriptional regulator [Verrucomicrobia bacterium]|nr:helix-turn-helix transcriptional regulator [Verrucomicrobiota bacterium]